MVDRERHSRRAHFVKRYEYLLIYIAIISTLTLVVALLDG